jgi:hypothetical protein
MFCVCDMMLMPAVISQLWRLLVASAVCPGLRVTQERTDEGERVKYESRQLGGFQMCCRRGDDDEGKSKLFGSRKNDLSIAMAEESDGGNVL